MDDKQDIHKPCLSSAWPRTGMPCSGMVMIIRGTLGHDSSVP